MYLFCVIHFERAEEVSLRLGHASGLTVHRTVIQHLGAASLHYFKKAEETAKAKYERLKKFVDFYS